MKASYINDKETGPGHGFLRIHEAGALAASEGIRFCIKRASDRKCLGLGGWQPAEVFLTPDACHQDGDTFQIYVGPAIVDNLDVQETYRLTLQGEDETPATSALHVAEVIYSPVSGGQGVQSIAAPKLVMQPKPVQNTVPQDPEPSVQIPETDSAKNAKPGTSKLPLIILLILILLGGGGFAAWKMLASDEPEEPPMNQARKHLSGTADPMGSLDLALRFRTAEGGADAAFLLAEDAAQKGNTSAMVLAGDFYSPVDTEPFGSIKKDPLEAFAWYTKAKSAGSAEASTRLAALHTWAKAEAQKGDEKAKELLAKFI